MEKLILTWILGIAFLLFGWHIVRLAPWAAKAAPSFEKPKPPKESEMLPVSWGATLLFIFLVMVFFDWLAR